MGLFSRKHENAQNDVSEKEISSNLKHEADSFPSAAGKNAGGQVKKPKILPSGPVDVSQVSEEKLESYADFGAFMIPMIPGLAVHPESPIDENKFGTLAIQYGKAVVELMAVAAPKSKEIWPEFRKELRGETTKQGNTCEEVCGSFGEELLVQLAVQTATGQRGRVQVRYCGVDGPNWFVRLVFNGIVDSNDSDLQALEAAVKSLVVVRGSRPMTPRSIIPVVLPDELAKQLAQLQQA